MPSKLRLRLTSELGAGLALLFCLVATGSACDSSPVGGDGGSSDGGGQRGGAGTSGAAGHAGAAGASGGAGSGSAGKSGGDCICADVYSPVCGVDGRTYPSACNASCASVTVAHTGACATAMPDAGGDGSVPLGYCDEVADCVSRQATCSCSSTCVALTDPAPTPSPVSCAFACPAIEAVACACLNHQCTPAVATAR